MGPSISQVLGPGRGRMEEIWAGERAEAEREGKMRAPVMPGRFDSKSQSCEKYCWRAKNASASALLFSGAAGGGRREERRNRLTLASVHVGCGATTDSDSHSTTRLYTHSTGMPTMYFADLPYILVCTLPATLLLAESRSNHKTLLYWR